METPGLVISFLTGIALFASPCVAPLIPAYLATISGVRLSELQQDEKRAVQRAILSHALVFVLGFSLVFVLLGTFVGYLSSLAVGFQVWLDRVGGALIIVLAFHMLGLIKIPLLEREAALGAPKGASGRWKSAIMGISFGISWTPCTGPVLGAILALSATTGSWLQAAALMSAFSAGLAVPFLMAGWFTMGAARLLARSPAALIWINRIAGVFLLALGVIVFSGRLQGLIGLFYRWL